MKTKGFRQLLCVGLSLICVFSTTVPTFAGEASVARNTADGILLWNLNKNGNASIQEWIDGELCANAAVSSEWYILSFVGAGNYNFDKYSAALSAYLENHTVNSASTALKIALVCYALGINDGYLSTVTSSDAVGKQGLMSLVWGLHLINNGVACKGYTAQSLISEILSARRADGGWSVVGEYSDVDVTAMTLQALAPYYEATEVRAAIDGAIALLSERQLADGNFASYGIANPESAAQVMSALSALGIDAASDERFIKNGNDLFDSILKFRLEDGSFAHTAGGSSNANATAQVFCAMTAYIRMTEGKSPLYIFNSDSVETDVTTERGEPTSENSENKEIPEDEQITSTKDDDKTEENKSYKLIACLIILAICGAVCIGLFIFKKRNIKNYFAVLLIGVIAVAFLLFTDISAPDDYYGQEMSKENAIGTVTLTIRCDEVAGVVDSEHIPDNGIILDNAVFEIEKGDTVYTVLVEAARKYSIQIENNGNSEMAYIVGINYLYEFDHGGLSGWIYRVNGERPGVGCGEVELGDGDTVEWIYSLDFGEQ